MIYVITYADEKYKATQKYNEKTAYRYGADIVYKFGPEDIERDFKERNREILEEIKGNGYWAWKPYFIYKVLQESEAGDWIVYSDSGLYFNRNIQNYIDKLLRKNRRMEMWSSEETPKHLNFAIQETRFMEKQFTKADVIHALECEEDRYLNSRQRAATVILLKNCDENKALVAEWLKYAQDKKLISDEIFMKNCNEFIANRHDQSILSLLCKKRDLPVDNNLFRDIVLPFHRKALLTYHHSTYGYKYQMYFSSLIRVFKWIF